MSVGINDGECPELSPCRPGWTMSKLGTFIKGGNNVLVRGSSVEERATWKEANLSWKNSENSGWGW